jgi:hypothetical protein
MTKFTMAASAVVLALAGLSASFLPQEIAASIGAEQLPLVPFAIQLIGALYLAFAMANWMARESLIGGIYNRPLAVANVLHFTMGALALVKGVVAGQRATAMLAAALVYSLFAIAFARVLFTSPVTTPPRA